MKRPLLGKVSLAIQCPVVAASGVLEPHIALALDLCSRIRGLFVERASGWLRLPQRTQDGSPKSSLVRHHTKPSGSAWRER
jgi:hypothetical protein